MQPQRVRHDLATKPPPPLEELKQTINLPNHQRGKCTHTNAKIFTGSGKTKYNISKIGYKTSLHL